MEDWSAAAKGIAEALSEDGGCESSTGERATILILQASRIALGMITALKI